ncbi:MAG TPA: isoquinoline 1-oxidoreductase [Polaromonas sp.]|uniref:xanthine dehydrogenase family protein molybdopterin-binding subunit n=1 Tax=Polaromonas sp. UBA4122 TaxID=1947074 RepID=UPI000EEE7E1B|nr:molybdopterin cofactor-binding domain-containing protein [Polaromonas sp. UBA4122]HAL39198.1 isoquinoline 1-oxidoreductase [Polaromonas sp.]
MSTSPGMSRRTFFKLAGGGIVVFVGLGPLAAHSQDAKRLYPEDFNAYLVIGENGRVTVFSGKIEMGQGVLTSQAQMVAEELGVELASIDMVLGDTDRCPWDMGTFGSLTTRMFGPALRAAAAKARVALMTLAAKKLDVPGEKLVVKGGIVYVAGEPNRNVSYGELSKGARIAQVVDQKAVLRAASEFRVMGGSPTRLDALEKVTGAAKYAADIRIPGMLYARILRPPMHGATLSQLDTVGAEKLPGITLVKRGDLVAVLHADPEAAGVALGRIKADWHLPEANVNQESIFTHIVKHSGELKNIVNRGDLAAARVGAARLFETSYHKGYVAHAAIEPHAAVAEIKGGKVTVWASTQTPFPTRDRLAKILGVDPKNVRVITPFVGGGFGGKSESGQAIEAARLAQIAGKPVQVAWTRSEEFFNDTFDPAAVVKIVSGIDHDGRISLWDYSVYAAGERGATSFYDIPNAWIRSAGRTSYDPAAAETSVHPFSVGPWRAPGANMNVFATESQIDIMASAAGSDPLAFRLRNLTDSRMHRVLQAAAAAFGWKAAATPSGRGFGLACSIDAGTYVATMAEVKVDPANGKVKVLRIVCAQDMGIVVNPDGAKMQIEGGITMGLGYVLTEELRFRGGEILDRNFDSYDIPRFSWVPRIETVLVKNDNLAPQGGGEPSITTTGAVIANAVFDATGARMFRLPMTTERVRQAIAAKNAKG